MELSFANTLTSHTGVVKVLTLIQSFDTTLKMLYELGALQEGFQ